MCPSGDEELRARRTSRRKRRGSGDSRYSVGILSQCLQKSSFGLARQDLPDFASGSHGVRRKSNVNGNAVLGSWVGMAMIPGVCPISLKRARRRLSASKALTGNWAYASPPGCTTWYVQPPIERPDHVSTISNTRGVCTGMFGWRHDAGCHARYRTPATNSPSSPVECSGTARPLHKTVKRESIIPDTFTCNRSTDESTLRTV